jgi:hypothetical protein
MGSVVLVLLSFTFIRSFFEMTPLTWSCCTSISQKKNQVADKESSEKELEVDKFMRFY